MKRLLFSALLGLCQIHAFAQAYIGPSADASGLARYISIPVSYYTGATGTSIPVAQTGGKELSVGVDLSYNATGIKVGDLPGSVGLGWSLNAGGLITRVVRGAPDDLANGFCTTSPSDQEPDLFFYSFLGQSGKFILDNAGNVVTIPYRNILIKPGICVNNTSVWQIIDESGVSYTFGATSGERETTTTTPVTGGSATSYTSSWFLSRMDSPNQTESITFTYV